MLRETRGRRLARRWVGVGSAGAVLAVGSLATAAPVASAASADPPRLVLSVDGQAWVRDVTTPVFDPGHVWTAGDTATYTVLFRNDSGEDAEGFAEMNLTGRAAEMFETRLRVDAGAWVPGPRSQVVPVAPGQVVRVELDLTLSSTSTNPRESRTADLAATVTLRGEGAGAGIDPDPRPSPDPGTRDGTGAVSGPGTGGVGSGTLATTGASVVWVAAAALALGLTGRWLLVVARRGSRRD